MWVDKVFWECMPFPELHSSEPTGQRVAHQAQASCVRRPFGQSQNKTLPLLVCGHDVLFCLPPYTGPERLQGSFTVSHS